MRILIVEDDASVAELCRRVLVDEGYDCVLARDAIAARAAVAKCPIDLLLADVVLPGDSSGADLAAEMEGGRPGILMMSGDDIALRRGGWDRISREAVSHPRAHLARAGRLEGDSRTAAVTARLRLALLAATVALVPSMSPAVDADPKDFVAALGQKTLLILNQKQLAPGDRERSLRVLFQGSFDIQQLSRFVLGQSWRTASEPQREEFVKLFESYIVQTYSTRLGTFGGEDFKVTGARAEGEATLVASQILRPNNAPAVKIDWQVAKVDGEARIGDVRVEGIGLALTQRQEFAAVIQRNGGQLESLLRLLRDRTKG